jgi:hypothetical protein
MKGLLHGSWVEIQKELQLNKGLIGRSLRIAGLLQRLIFFKAHSMAKISEYVRLLPETEIKFSSWLNLFIGLRFFSR